MIAKHAVYTETGDLELWESEVPSPEPGGLLVRVGMAGVCGTDNHILLGHVPFPFPVTFGHEGVGVVEELGEGVTTDRIGEPLQVGDRVFWSPLRPCHHCYYCTVQHDFSSCVAPGWPDPATRPSGASYSELAWLGADTYYYRIPDDTSSESVIAFGCAMPTMLQGMERLGSIGRTDNVVIQGCGPVGIAATFLTSLAGPRQIIVIGAPANRLAFAERFGATTTISLDDGSPEDRVARVRELCDGRGADVVIEAAGQLPAFSEGLELIAHNGRYLIVGLWGGTGTIPVDPHYINNHNLTIQGTQFSKPRHYYLATRVAQRWSKTYPFADAITHRFPLEESRAAIEAVGRGEPVKAVVVPG